jgi:hypothetical protein
MPAAAAYCRSGKITILIRFWKGAGIVSRKLFWLTDDQWKRIEPRLPTDVRGVERADDRRVISGIVHVFEKRLPLVRLPASHALITDPSGRYVTMFYVSKDKCLAAQYSIMHLAKRSLALRSDLRCLRYFEMELTMSLWKLRTLTLIWQS